MKYIVISMLLVLVARPALAETNSPKPEYEAPSYLPDPKLAELAVQDIIRRGRDKKCDHTRPYVMHTPSQMGDALVGFVAGATPDDEGYLKLYCVVEVNAITGRVGKLRVFPDPEGKTIYVHLDEDGKVTGFKTGEAPTKPSTATK